MDKRNVMSIAFRGAKTAATSKYDHPDGRIIGSARFVSRLLRS
jgi:hypothetical protein